MRDVLCILALVLGSVWIAAFGISLWPDPTNPWYAVPVTMSAVVIWGFLCVVVAHWRSLTKG